MLLEGATLPASEFARCRLLVEGIDGVWQKLVVPQPLQGDATVRATNRWGETVFRYIHQVLDRSQHMRMLYVDVFVRAKLFAYRVRAHSDPARSQAVQAIAREPMFSLQIRQITLVPCPVNWLGKKGRPGIEPGYPRPRRGVLPLNYLPDALHPLIM